VVVEKPPEVVVAATDQGPSSRMKAVGALALAAIPLSQNAHSAVQPDYGEVAVRVSQYQEDDSPAERTLYPVTERFSIDVNQLRIAAPVGRRWYLETELVYETLSGASPMQTYKNEDGQSVLVTSGATIDEERTQGSFSATHYFSEGTLGLMLASSSENDYESLAFGMNGTLELSNKSTTLQGSWSMSNDTINPSDPEISVVRQEATDAKKRSLSIYEGVTQVINRRIVVQGGVGYTRHSGYLSDPYKFEDRRPSTRDQVTANISYRQYLYAGRAAALHLDYVWYTDNWGIRSQSLTTKWVQSWQLWSMTTFQLAPMWRYYRQTEASFYRLEQDPPDNEFSSSDARLSSYGATSLGVEAELKIDMISLTASYENYMSSTDLGILQKSNDEAPGLVSFQVWGAGITWRF